jgi:hypothetical protein
VRGWGVVCVGGRWESELGRWSADFGLIRTEVFRWRAGLGGSGADTMGPLERGMLSGLLGNLGLESPESAGRTSAPTFVGPGGPRPWRWGRRHAELEDDDADAVPVQELDLWAAGEGGATSAVAGARRRGAGDAVGGPLGPHSSYGPVAEASATWSSWVSGAEEGGAGASRAEEAERSAAPRMHAQSSFGSESVASHMLPSLQSGVDGSWRGAPGASFATSMSGASRASFVSESSPLDSPVASSTPAARVGGPAGYAAGGGGSMAEPSVLSVLRGRPEMPPGLYASGASVYSAGAALSGGVGEGGPPPMPGRPISLSSPMPPGLLPSRIYRMSLGGPVGVSGAGGGGGRGPAPRSTEPLLRDPPSLSSVVWVPVSHDVHDLHALHARAASMAAAASAPGSPAPHMERQHSAASSHSTLSSSSHSSQSSTRSGLSGSSFGSTGSMSGAATTGGMSGGVGGGVTGGLGAAGGLMGGLPPSPRARRTLHIAHLRPHESDTYFAVLFQNYDIARIRCSGRSTNPADRMAFVAFRSEEGAQQAYTVLTSMVEYRDRVEWARSDMREVPSGAGGVSAATMALSSGPPPSPGGGGGGGSASPYAHHHP